VSDVTGTQFLLGQQRQFEVSLGAAGSRVIAAKSLMDLVRAANLRPSIPGHMRCLVRPAQARFDRIVERSGESLLSTRLEHLKTLAGTEAFCEEAGRLRQDLRYLGPLLGRFATQAPRQIDVISHRAGEGASRPTAPTMRG